MSIIDGSMRIPEKVIQPAVEKKSEVIKEAEAHPRSEDKVTLGEKVKGLAEEAVGFAIAAPVAAVALPVGIIGNAIKGGERGAIKALGAKNRFPEGDTVKIAGRVGQNKLVIKFDRVGERDAVEAASVFGPLVPLYVLYGLAGVFGWMAGGIAWGIQGDKIREAVNKNVDKSTKIVFGPEKPDKRSTLHKVSDAALGYVVGSIKGGETGAEKYIDGSLKLGEKIASKIFKGK